MKLPIQQLRPLDPVDYYQSASEGPLHYRTSTGAVAVVIVSRRNTPLGYLCDCSLAHCELLLQGGLLELAQRTDIACAAFAVRRDRLIAAAGDLTHARAQLRIVAGALRLHQARAELQQALSAADRTGRRRTHS